MALHCPECGRRVASKANLKAHQGPNGACTHDANKRSVTPANVTSSRATAQVTKSPSKPAIFEREPPTPVTEIRSKSQSQGHSHTSRISIFSFGRKRRQLEQKSYGANVFKTAPELFQPFPVGVLASQVCPHCHNSGLSSPGTPCSYCSGGRMVRASLRLKRAF